MEFPLINISQILWEDEFIIDYIVFDEYYYSENNKYFNKLFLNKKFCASDGKIYIAKGLIPPQETWRKVLKFLPDVYKSKIIFERTEKEISMEELRKYLLKKVQTLSDSESKTTWIQDLKKAKNHYELINGTEN